MRPVPMPPNVIDHFYLGGERLAAFRGVPLPSPRRPEEWLAATVHRADEPDVGRSRMPDGSLFAELVAADPRGWTGTPDAPAGPADTGILVKLLDAGQRLPVHVHPTRPFARDHLHSCYGKTEAWYVLETHGDDPAVWVGFREDVDPDVLADRVDAQDSAWMLAHLNKISVRPGDGIVVPAGQAHATGAGVFLVEVQEPTDFSILLEWSVTTATRDESHLGLGFDVVLPAVSHRALTAVDELRLPRRPRSAGRWARARAGRGRRPVLPARRRRARRRERHRAARLRGGGRARRRRDRLGGRRAGGRAGRGLRRAGRDRRLDGLGGGERGRVQAQRGLAGGQRAG